MSNCSCSCSNRNDCIIIALAASIIIGITAAILRYIAVITVTPAFLWVVFGIAVAFLALAFIAGLNSRGCADECVCRTLRVWLGAVLITILLAVVLLAIAFAATSVLGAILTGVLIAAFSAIITTTACFIFCIADCR